MTSTEKREVNKRFCVDMNITIKLLDDELFQPRLTLYDRYYHCLPAYNEFCEMVERYGDFENYMSYYEDVKDRAVTYLENRPGLSEFAEFVNRLQEETKRLNAQKGKKPNYPKKDIYKSRNNKLFFVSFDMKKGNFTAMHHFNPELVGGYSTFEELIQKFTNEPHLCRSKRFRQVIFGKANVPVQTAYQSYLMDQVMQDAFSVLNESMVRYKAADEVIFELTEVQALSMSHTFEQIVNANVSKGINIRYEIFQLYQIPGIGYIKQVLDGEQPIIIKMANHKTMPFLIRALCDMKPQPNDYLYSNDNGDILTLNEPPEIILPDNLRLM